MTDEVHPNNTEKQSISLKGERNNTAQRACCAEGLLRRGLTAQRACCAEGLRKAWKSRRKTIKLTKNVNSLVL